MTTKITPTVGRVVWFYPATTADICAFATPSAGEPLAAIIANVIDDQTLNLAVFDAKGAAHSCMGVQLIQGDDPAPGPGYFATWMPYQIGQAKKQANEVARAGEPKTSAAAQTSNTGLHFGHALEAMKRGHRVARAGWNGKGQFVLIVQGSNKLASVHGFGFGEAMGEPTFGDTMFLRTVDNRLIAWTPSQSDALAEDWQIVA